MQDTSDNRMLLAGGVRVRLHSLASRADLNGCTATLIEYVDGRWNAVLDSGEGVRWGAKYVTCVKSVHGGRDGVLGTLKLRRASGRALLTFQTS